MSSGYEREINKVIIVIIVNDIGNKSYMNCGNEMKRKKRSSQWTQIMQLRKEAWKSSGLDLTITGAMLYQLSYEAIDVSGFIA